MFAVTTCYLSLGFRGSDTWPDQRAPLKTPCDSEPVCACAGNGGAASNGNQRGKSPQAPPRLPAPRLVAPTSLPCAPGGAARAAVPLLLHAVSSTRSLPLAPKLATRRFKDRFPTLQPQVLFLILGVCPFGPHLARRGFKAPRLIVWYFSFTNRYRLLKSGFQLRVREAILKSGRNQNPSSNTFMGSDCKDHRFQVLPSV